MTRFFEVDSGYQARLGQMEDWYRELVRLEDREQLLLDDYAPHRDHLAGLRGSVIDIGGGAGLAARFLHPDLEYVVVDPSEVWASPEWVGFAKSFRSPGPEPTFVRAAGEKLPFPDGRFDSALSFWSLNHVEDPERCILEMGRVLKPGGSARIVVEDIEPGWPELLADGARRAAARLTGRHREAKIKSPFMAAVWMKLGGRWPTQEDHIAFGQRQLLSWLAPVFSVRRREWLGGWLTLDVVRR